MEDINILYEEWKKSNSISISSQEERDISKDTSKDGKLKSRRDGKFVYNESLGIVGPRTAIQKLEEITEAENVESFTPVTRIIPDYPIRIDKLSIMYPKYDRLTLKESNMYYNLDTNRKVTKTRTKRFYDERYNVAYTDPALHAYFLKSIQFTKKHFVNVIPIVEHSEVIKPGIYVYLYKKIRIYGEYNQIQSVVEKLKLPFPGDTTLVKCK